MKNLEHFKKLVESEGMDYSKIDKLTVTGKDGKKTVHKASENGKTVEEVESENNEDTDKTKQKKKVDQYKKDSKEKEESNDSKDSKDNETKKED